MNIFAKVSVCALLCLAASSQAFALQVKRGAFRSKEIFSVSMPDGTSFFGKENMIVSISLQKYRLEAFVLTEVNVQFLGENALIRIYNATPSNLADEIFSAARSRLPKPLSEVNPPIKDKLPVVKKAENAIKKSTKVDFVSKNYPATTHAKTVEFVVPDLEELLAFYDQISSDFAPLKEESSTTIKTKNDSGKIGGTLYTIELLDD